MVRAWYIESADDGSVPEDEKLIELAAVTSSTAVRIYCIKVTKDVDDPQFLKLKQDMNIRSEDVIVIAKGSPDYDKQKQQFGVEHLHADEEIRWVETGIMYFDIRTPDDRWLRVELSDGDLIVLPSGIYHRLGMLPDNSYIKIRRYFSNEAQWTAHLRPADDHPARIKYLATMAAK